MPREPSAVTPVTIVDVANRAGVSISSVSTALNGKAGVSEETRERIRTVAREMGFVPSLRGKSLRAKRAFAVGLVVQRGADVLEEDPFFASFIAGAESVLSRRSYALVLQMAATPEDSLRHYHELITNRRVDGVFLNELEVDDRRIELVDDLGAHSVAINTDVEETRIPAVRQDYARGIENLVNYLAGVGHRRIAFLTGPQNFLHSGQREKAWRRALQQLGLEPGEVFVGDFTYRSGADAANRIAALSDRPTAVVAANDLMAIGAIVRLQDLGLRVPEDISIAGYDGISIGDYLRPRLTTLRTSPFDLAAAAADMLLGQIHGTPRGDVRISDAQLELKDSTGPSPAM